MTKGPKGIHRSDLVDELTDAIEAINDTKATGKHLVRLASVIEMLQARRDALSTGNEFTIYQYPKRVVGAPV